MQKIAGGNAAKLNKMWVFGFSGDQGIWVERSRRTMGEERTSLDCLGRGYRCDGVFGRAGQIDGGETDREIAGLGRMVHHACGWAASRGEGECGLQMRAVLVASGENGGHVLIVRGPFADSIATVSERVSPAFSP